MSDKSYGDCTNRNVVKNPLLSTAVTGLSVEDLTHNAVLLPAVPSQELITRQDQENESQNITQGHSDHDITNYPSGDNVFNSPQFKPPSHINLNTIEQQKQSKNLKNNENSMSYKSKDTIKSDDDFDVNEYFARLQGTRYVSAPINSHLKEDQNANLQAEENLEEINLNEPEKAGDADVQHSLTTDIAQNFSQLPTVLPQVASAVFSSFSNMLSLKSREQTPDAKNYQIAQMPDITPQVLPEPVPAAPPKEPPTSSNTTNYRITTKKKVYAQIPGLCYGDNHLHVINTTTISQTVNYFTPDMSQATGQGNLSFDLSQDAIRGEDMQRREEMKTYDMFNKNVLHTDSGPQQEIIPIDTYKQSTVIPKQEETINLQQNVFINQSHIKPALQTNEFDQINTNIQEKQDPLDYSANQFIPISQEPAAIIPPPPMFSSVPRKDSQSSGKSILPPSVARRIGANQPVIKNQTSHIPLPDNIFIPAMTSEIDHQENRELKTNLSQHIKDPMHISAAPSKDFVISNPNIQTTIATSQDMINASFFTQPAQTADVPSMKLSQKDLIDSKLEADLAISNDSIKQPSNILGQNTISLEKTEESRAPPIFFNPANLRQTTRKPSLQEDQSNSAAQNTASLFTNQDITNEPPKAIPEPPKLSGNLNYRMTKKRPQYYSGPIEGFGSISNNVKPTIPPVESNVYTGSLSSSDQVQSAHNFSVDNAPIVQNPSSNLAAQSNINPYIAQGQSLGQNDYNTAFDLSRPTTERYEEPQPVQPKGFGIIGSLKSKLSALDINKIQNTVTTFFDPTYNESKMNPIKGTESSFNLASGSYQNFPQHETATLDVFVPNTDNQYHQANPYNYQIQTHQLYQNEQYYPNQEFFNSSQNYPNNFYQNYAINSDLSKTGAYVTASHAMPETQGSDANVQLTNMQPFTGSCNQENIQSVVNPIDGKILQGINNTQVVEPIKNVFDAFGKIDNAKPENIISHLKPTALSDMSEVIEEIALADSLENYSGCPEKVIKPPSNLYKEIKAISLNKTEDKYIGSDDIIKELQSVADSTLKKVFDCQTPLVVESALEPDIQEPLVIPKPIDPLKSFFDYQQPIFPIGAIQKEDIKLADCNPLTNVDSSIKSFFDYPAPPTNLGFGLKDEFAIHNTQSVINTGHALTFHPESEEFKGLSSVLKTKSEDLHTPTVSTVQNTFNDTPLFSLFDQPTLLPAMPSFDLTKISSCSLPASINESADARNIDNLPLNENNNMAMFERKSSFFDKTLPIEIDNKLVDDQASELSICGTCREVNKSEEKEADLTSQLIENIIAPIKLAHPVEFPAAVGAAVGTSVPDISEFSNQFAEISHIPEDIIETMKQPPSAGIEEDNINAATNFGWSVGESKQKAIVDHDYNFPPDPNNIGFFGDNSLFFDNVPTNASDEIKAEYKISQEDTAILPRQLSTPTAPPEEDNNSDESGLDVHSIELDAKKDFPIFEDFVIEPSGTDDDKIEFKERERYSDDTPQDVDTFTNRVERFKQIQTSTDVVDVTEVQKAKPITLATTKSPAITIASYFDTGNYAVENHYRNSITSPTTILLSTDFSSSTSIPPGFEDEYKRKLSDISSTEMPVGFYVGNIVHIPETTTQTEMTTSLTYTQPSNVAPLNVVTTESVSLSSSLVQEVVMTKTERLPAFPSIIEPKNETAEDRKPVDDEVPETKPVDTLPDSIDFFSTTENSSNSDAYSNYSRLSSYFTSPPQPDHSKSFFELSQSQNHYRHKSEQLDSIETNVKNFFESDSKTNIPKNYLSNMNLVRDLASYKDIKKDDTIKTVNYFTVEYDIDAINLGEPKSIIDLAEKTNNYDRPNELGTDDVNFNIEEIIQKCKYCHDKLNIDLNSTDSKFKTHMDNTETKKGDANMDTKKDNKKTVTVNFYDATYNDANEAVVVTSENRNTSEYAPVKHHWFYRVDFEGKSIWRGFSVADSRALENAFISPDLNENTVVATDGGRFDVNVVGRLRIPVYWADKPTNVMRCSWFYKGNIDARYVPYAESVAEKLEEEYHHGITTGEWHRRLMLPNNEMVVMHGPAVMVHFLQTSPTDGFGSSPQSAMRPRVVRRGCVESEIEDTEPSSIDHLLLLCHGVGSACDMRFRSVEEVVDDFRATSLQLIQSHYKNSYDSGLIGRVEVLPISWHSSLHSGETGVDRRLAAVTLESIPRLRNFTNDTILDVLFYTSPVYCQTIVETVCGELNRIYKLFKSRNPDFDGGVSLGGHSLGSVILYDLLCHQTAQSLESNSSKQYVTGCAGTGQPCVKYPKLMFQPDALYALGSPIAIFECIRGVETLGKDFCLPTCKNFFNIFHPYDPIAYRLEPMINPLLRNVKPLLIPHHKGRKRMHLELKDTMARVGADIKQKLIESIRSTWTSMWRRESTGQGAEVVEEEVEKEELTADNKEENNTIEATAEELGLLNGGRRIDHVLQEAPFEIFNEYLFAMTSHVCYWESEDTMLVMLREIYNALGVSPDCSLPQQTMTVERSRADDPDTAKLVVSEYPSTSRGSS